MTRHCAGEGTIIQRTDGRWQASLQVDGQRRTVYGKTRQAVSDKLRTLRRASPLALPGTHTLGDLFAHWLSAVSPTLKASTIADYEKVWRLYLAPQLGQVRLSKLTPERIQRVYGGLQARGLERAAAKAHMVLHRMGRLGALWGLLDDNPCDRVLKPSYAPERKALWTPWELNVFLRGGRGHRLYPLFVVALASGCRLGELLALTWADVDPEAGTLHIAKTLHRIQGAWVTTTPKTHSGARTIALPREGIDALQRQREQEPDSALVFCQQDGNPLHGPDVARVLRGLCRRLGIRAVTPHGLRHLHASLLLQDGLPVPVVSARLGHAHAGITMAVYAHVVGEQDHEAASTIGRALAGSR